MNDLTVVIFSKDRACQLHLCLTSLIEKFDALMYINVQYTSSNDEYEKGYMDCAKIFDSVDFIRENDFQSMCKNILETVNTPYILFLVDDDVFINAITEKEYCEMTNILDITDNIHCGSIRMNKTVNKCYPANNKDMEIPILLEYGNLFNWNWTEAKDQHTCWGYPMSMTAHIYKSNEIIPLIQKGKFNNVNSLEAFINANRFRNKHYMVSFKDSKVFNVQNNFVQGNRVNEHSYTIEWLNEQYMNNKTISTKNIYGLKRNACHGTIEYIME